MANSRILPIIAKIAEFFERKKTNKESLKVRGLNLGFLLSIYTFEKTKFTEPNKM